MHTKRKRPQQMKKPLPKESHSCTLFYPEFTQRMKLLQLSFYYNMRTSSQGCDFAAVKAA